MAETTSPPPLASAALLLLPLLPLAAQPPLQVNTTVRSFTSVAGSPWVADIWAYDDGMGGEFALVCQGDIGMSIYEVTNPAAPVFASSIAATGSDLKDVKTIPGYAFCVQQSGPVLVVDISNPYAASITTSFSGGGHNGFLRDGYFYFARQGGSPNGLEIWDVSTPASPVFTALFDPPGFDCHDVYVEDDIAYASRSFGSGRGTYILDVTNKSNPVHLSTIVHGSIPHSSWLYHPPGGRKVLVANNEGAGGRARFFDVTDPTSPVYLSEYVTDPSISIHNPMVSGRYAFISYYADYLRILDLANPAQPVEVGVYDPAPNNAGVSVFDGAWGVALVNPTRVLLTESFSAPRGFWVIDFSPPPALDLALTTTGAGDLSLQVTGADAGTELWCPVSLDTTQTFGAGPVAGLQVDAFSTLMFPLGTHPFHVLADASGGYLLNIPGGIPPGLSVDVRCIGLAGGSFTGSQVGRMTF